MKKIEGSFRDPDGSVFDHSGRILRGVKSHRREEVVRFLESSFYKNNAGSKIVSTRLLSDGDVDTVGITESPFDLWVEHQKINFVSYPFEWCFESLKAAALLYLELHIEALNHGFDMIDASAYNIQFVGARPIFIDLLSFRPYKEDAAWLGYKQFCEQFLGPLALNAVGGIEFNNWYRGSLDGIDIGAVSKALPLKSYFSWSLLANVHLHAWALARATSTATRPGYAKTPRHMPKRNYQALLTTLANYIEKLQPRSSTYWRAYAANTSYSADETQVKQSCVAAFIKENGVKRIVDIGCNTGVYSIAALKAGAEEAIATDIDHGALNVAAAVAERENLRLLPLCLDVTNPSPAMGWNLSERTGFVARLHDIDASLSLALVHHVAIGKNVPLSSFADWLVSLAPTGLTEFVPKGDPMVQGLLESREDIFTDYNLENYLNYLGKAAEIIKVEKISESERTLITFKRK